MASTVGWVAISVCGHSRTVPMLFSGDRMVFDASAYFAAPSRAAMSPSALGREAATVRKLFDECHPEAPDPAKAKDPEWEQGIERLRRASKMDEGARVLLGRAGDFLAYLVIEDVLPLSGAGLAAVFAKASRPNGGRRRRKAESLLAHIMPKAGSRGFLLERAAAPRSQP